jgi:hypothetical protein
MNHGMTVQNTAAMAARPSDLCSTSEMLGKACYGIRDRLQQIVTTLAGPVPEPGNPTANKMTAPGVAGNLSGAVEVAEECHRLLGAIEGVIGNNRTA